MFRSFCKGRPLNGPFSVPELCVQLFSAEASGTGSGGACYREIVLMDKGLVRRGDAALLRSETSCVAARASFTIDCDLVTRYR
jgi:hypothetical protein